MINFKILWIAFKVQHARVLNNVIFTFHMSTFLFTASLHMQVKLETKGDQTLFNYRRSPGPFPA